ncbi:MAG TPA: metallophosphoesterase [Bryobacteraceae bacterium]|nr:metallophosphoesterase [Bryobacteraceae bacterium]
MMTASTSSAQMRVAWVQLGPDRGISARAIIAKENRCPSIVIDGRAAAMRPRTPVPQGFPPICEASIPPGTREASIDGQVLALPQADFKRIVVVGDTGCRVRVKASTGESEIQNCAEDWHFKSLADAAMARKPDLVIHTGDYVYRENEGFEWNSWYADFFQPANGLLRAAPWIFVRGNHESCKDGGIGWFYLLDVKPYSGSCSTERSEPYVVNAGNIPFLLLDSSEAEELRSKRSQVIEYSGQLKRINAAAIVGAWVLSHQPFWAFRREAGDTERGELDTVNDTLQSVWRESPLPDAALILSGHIHMFQALGFADRRPPQIVIGNSGTELARRIRGPFEGRKIARSTVSGSAILRKFGFAEFNGHETGWQLSVHGLEGKELECSLASKTLSCGN